MKKNHLNLNFNDPRHVITTDANGKPLEVRKE